MAIYSDLHQEWVLFRASVSAFCAAERAAAKRLAVTETQWHLGRIEAIVGAITPKSMPTLSPVFLDTLLDFVEDWAPVPEEMRRGTWNERRDMLTTYLGEQARVVEDAISEIRAAEEAAGLGSTKPSAGPAAPCEDTPETEEAVDPVYAMHFDGAHWHITYGREKGFVNDCKGAGHVAKLLECAGKAIPCDILHGSSERTLTANDPTISRNDAEEELARLRVELAEIDRRMEERPYEVLPEDQEERQAIIDRAKELKGLGGKPRQKGAVGGSRAAVTQAVGRFYAACRKKDLDAFVDHLKANVETGADLLYRGKLSWKISSVTPDVTM